jgi:hypothetical protein
MLNLFLICSFSISFFALSLCLFLPMSSLPRSSSLYFALFFIFSLLLRSPFFLSLFPVILTASSYFGHHCGAGLAKQSRGLHMGIIQAIARLEGQTAEVFACV